MKKQKKPIVLVLALPVLLIGVFYAHNYFDPSTDHSAPQQQDQKPEEKDAVAADVKKEMKDPKKPDGPTPSVASTTGARTRPKMGGPGADVPLILRIKSQPYKPKPSDSSTATQWWDKDSAKNTPIN